MTTFFTILTLLILVSCQKTTQTENSVTTAKSSTVSGNIWRGTFPKEVRISNDFTALEASIIETMSTNWSKALNHKETFIVFGPRVSDISNNIVKLDQLHDEVLGVYKSTNWPDAQLSSALAVTQIFGYRYNKGQPTEFMEMVHADIIVNYEHPFRTGDSGTGYDLQTVILHEAGHFLGLEHDLLPISLRNESVMYPSIRESDQKRYPRPRDAQSLADIYGISLTNTVSPAMRRARSLMQYRSADDPGEEVKVILELHADGDCVHKVDGAEIGRHHVKLDYR